MWRQALLLVVVVVVGVSVGQIQDATRQAGAAGPRVVEAVISLIRESCLFPNDRNMLRRFAYMITNDGQDPATYRQGFDGGIWSVTQAQFQATQNDPNLQQYYSGISTRFGISWNNIQWSELRKPLYSGLATALYLVQTFGNQVPVGLERQAAWYQKIYFPNDAMAAYNFTKQADNILSGCTSSNLDLAFLVDSSSSLRPVDFTDALNFAADVVDKFTVSPNDVQVALLTFGTGFKTVFDFNDQSTKAGVQAAIHAAVYQPGETDTDQALNYAASALFVPGGAAGARPSSAKVAVLVTDGQATHSADAVRRAQELRQKGVTVFVIGVGSEVDVAELNMLATEPHCTHVQLLTDYRDLDTLKAEMERLSCRAPVILTEGNYSFPCDTESNFRIAINGNETITISPNNGFVDIYGSFLNPYPNSAFNEFKTRATSVREAIIYVKDESRPLYLSIVSKGLDPVLCGPGKQYTVTVQNKNAIQPDALITCYENGIVRQCTPLDLLTAIYHVVKPASLGFPNPCQSGHPGYFPHPNAYDRFVYCDNNGDAYLVFCPSNFWYNDNARACVPGTPPTITTPRPVIAHTTPTPTYVTSQPGGNPCTQAALDHGDRFFPHPDPLKYIACTEWPNYGVVKDCPPYHKWSQHDLACIYYQTVVDPTKNIYITTPSPIAVDCKAGLTDNSLYYHPYPGDNTKFIQCDQFGDAFVMDCPPGRIWNQHFLTCAPNGLLPSDNSPIG